jgi:hypothetical protein
MFFMSDCSYSDRFGRNSTKADCLNRHLWNIISCRNLVPPPVKRSIILLGPPNIARITGEPAYYLDEQTVPLMMDIIDLCRTIQIESLKIGLYTLNDWPLDQNPIVLVGPRNDTGVYASGSRIESTFWEYDLMGLSNNCQVLPKNIPKPGIWDAAGVLISFGYFVKFINRAKNPRTVTAGCQTSLNNVSAQVDEAVRQWAAGRRSLAGPVQPVISSQFWTGLLYTKWFNLDMVGTPDLTDFMFSWFRIAPFCPLERAAHISRVMLENTRQVLVAENILSVALSKKQNRIERLNIKTSKKAALAEARIAKKLCKKERQDLILAKKSQKKAGPLATTCGASQLSDNRIEHTSQTIQRLQGCECCPGTEHSGSQPDCNASQNVLPRFENHDPNGKRKRSRTNTTPNKRSANVSPADPNIDSLQYIAIDQDDDTADIIGYSLSGSSCEMSLSQDVIFSGFCDDDLSKGNVFENCEEWD